MNSAGSDRVSCRCLAAAAVLLFLLFLLVLPARADHPQDGNHDLAEMPADCVGCHNSSGGTNLSVIGEHKERLGYDNHRLCAHCHYNPDSPYFDDPTFPWDDDPDLALAVAFGRRNTNPRGYIEPVYCAYCHVTENRSTHLHAGEHDQVEVPANCAGCHGDDLVAIHIDPEKNLPDENLLPPPGWPNSPEREAYEAAYAYGIFDLKLSCYSCHGDAVIGTAPWDTGKVYFQPDPQVRSTVAAGMGGTVVSCADCHGTVDHDGAHDHAVITPGGCSSCHSADITEEHIDNQGLECATCHDNPDPEVKAAIKQGKYGVDVDCTSCHGDLDHEGAHDHAVLPAGDCQRCHYAAVVSEHQSRGYECAVCHQSSDPVVQAAISAGMGGSDVDCYACHADAAAGHAAAHEHIYLHAGAGDADVVITTGDDGSDGFYDDLPAYRPSLTCGGCHAGLAANHQGNFHSGLRVSELFAADGSPRPRGSIDPARPWITGPGMLGNWCPSAHRQLPDLTATFGDENAFKAAVDLGVFAFIRECGSCHVGGGPGVENPFGFAGFASRYLDDPVRDAALDSGSVALNAWDYYVAADGTVVRGDWTASGVLDVDCLMCHLEGYDHLARNAELRSAARFGPAAAVGAGLGVVDAAAAPPNQVDYAVSAVGREADGRLYLKGDVVRRLRGTPPDGNCLACHLPEMVVGEQAGELGEYWEGRFYAAAAVPSTDPGNPDPLVAANRKPALARNAMLKRGGTWRGDEVHKFMGCGGCHSRTSKTQSFDPGATSSPYLHSPGKGVDPLKYPSAADGTVKFCEDCHVHYGDLDDDGRQDCLDYAPPEMQVRHAQAGLLAAIVPTARRIADGDGHEETFTGNHLDVLSCTACHVQKRYSAARLVDYSTGGRYYNYVGTPPDQVPPGSEVPLAYTWKENTPVRVIAGRPNPTWRRQIFPFNYLTSVYWDNTGSADANGDGFTTGALNQGVAVSGDPFFARLIRGRFSYDYVNAANDRVASGLPGVSGLEERDGWQATTWDGSVMFTSAGEIDAFQAVLAALSPGYQARLDLESRPFLVVHNVMPIRSGVGLSGGAAYALGAPQRDALGNVTAYGCGDCHGGGGGVFNGSYDLLGPGRSPVDGSPVPLTVSWSDAGDVRATALCWDRSGQPLTVDFSSGNQTREPWRWEFLGYDAARVAALNAVDPADYGLGAAPTAAIASIGGQAPGGSPLVFPVGSTVDLVAASGGSGAFTYRWNVNDEAGSLTGQTVSKTFARTGLWRVLLTVVSAEGRLSQASQLVNVTAPGPATQVQVGTTAGSARVTFTLSDLPPHDQLRFYFGDGTRQFISNGDASYSLVRDYHLLSRNLNASGTAYEYKTSIRVHLGGETVEVVNVTVTIPR